MNKITTWAKEIAATIMASLAGPDSIAISITVWSTCSWKVVNKRFEANSLMLEVVSPIFNNHQYQPFRRWGSPPPSSSSPHRRYSHSSPSTDCCHNRPSWPAQEFFAHVLCIVSPPWLSASPSVECLRISWVKSLLSWIPIYWTWNFACQAFYLWSFSFKAALTLFKTKVIDVWWLSRRGDRFPFWKNSCHTPSQKYFVKTTWLCASSCADGPQEKKQRRGGESHNYVIKIREHGLESTQNEPSIQRSPAHGHSSDFPPTPTQTDTLGADMRKCKKVMQT